MLKRQYQLLLLAFIAMGIFYPTIFGTANSLDDVRMLHGLLNSPHKSLLDLFHFGGSDNYFRPLLMLTFYADRYFWMLEESFMHLENVLLHLANGFFVYLIAREIEKALDSVQKASWMPFCAALLFVIHPINTEPVNWISGRTDVLAGTFLLPGVWMLLKGLRKDRAFWSCSGALFFFCSCLSKETAVFFFPAGVLLCLADIDKSGFLSWRLGLPRVARHYLAWGVALAGYLAMRYSAKPFDKGVHRVAGAAKGQNYDYFDSLFLVFKSAGFYLKKFFIPWPLNMAIIRVSDFYVVVGILVLVLVLFCFFRFRLLSGVCLAALSLMSSAVLVRLIKMTWTPYAERYLYLPAAFASVALVLFIGHQLRLMGREKLGLLMLIPVMAAFAVSTVQRNFIWQSNLSLYQDTNRKTPNFAPVRNELAVALASHGKTKEAVEIFKNNTGREGRNKLDHFKMNRAVALWHEGRREEAGKLFWEAAKESKRSAPRILKGYLKLLDSQLFEDAASEDRVITLERIALLQEELYRRTKDPFWLYRQGRTQMTKGNPGKALELFKSAYSKAPEQAFYKAPAGKFVTNIQARMND